MTEPSMTDDQQQQHRALDALAENLDQKLAQVEAHRAYWQVMQQVMRTSERELRTEWQPRLKREPDTAGLPLPQLEAERQDVYFLRGHPMFDEVAAENRRLRVRLVRLNAILTSKSINRFVRRTAYHVGRVGKGALCLVLRWVAPRFCKD